MSRTNELNNENMEKVNDIAENSSKEKLKSIQETKNENENHSDDNNSPNDKSNNEEEENKEEEIDILLDTLPYKKRHSISRTITPKETFVDEKPNDEQNTKISSLLQISDKDGTGSNVKEYFVNVEEEEVDENPEEKEDEEEFSHNISLFSLSSSSEHKSPSFLVSTHGHEIHGLENELQEHRSHKVSEYHHEDDNNEDKAKILATEGVIKTVRTEFKAGDEIIKLQVNLDKNATIDEGHIAIPENDRLTVGERVFDLTGIRRQIEWLFGNPLPKAPEKTEEQVDKTVEKVEENQ